MEKQLELEKRYLFTNKDLRRLILPLILEQLLAVLVGMADTVMVASVGESAVSGVSLVDSINILLINIFAALATGGAVVAGQYLGRKDQEKAVEAGEQLLVFVVFAALLIMTLGYLGKNFILDVLFGKIAPDVRMHANIYLLIVFASIPFIALYNSGAALFRTMGNSQVTLKISVLMNVINVVGNAVLIYGFGLGAAGAAASTLLSRAVGAVIITILLTNEDLLIHIRKPFKYKFNKDLVRKILFLGIPNGVENSMFQLGKILLLSVVSGFGTASITANAVGNSVTAFGILPGAAMGLALVSVVSRCVGAREYDQVRYYTKKLLKYAYIAEIAVNGLILLSLPLIIRMYGLSPETAKMAKEINIVHGVFACLIWPLAFTLPNTLRAANDVRFTMLVGVGSMWTFRIGSSILLATTFGLGVLGIWWGMIIDWVVRSTFFVLRYKSNRWHKHHLV